MPKLRFLSRQGLSIRAEQTIALPTIDIDGRGSTIQEAIADMWKRVESLEKKGYHPITSVEIVDTKKKEVVETYMLTDPELKARLFQGSESKQGRATEPGKASYLARVRMEY